MITTWGKFTSLINALSKWLSDSFDQLLNWALSDHSTEENKKPADNTTKILDNILFYGNYSIYGSKYQVKDIPWDKITQVVYAFGMVGNSLPDPDIAATEWIIYETTRKLSEKTTGLTNEDIKSLKTALPMVEKGQDKIYNLLHITRNKALMQLPIDKLKEGDKIAYPKLPGRVSTNYGIIDKSQADQIEGVIREGQGYKYATGSTGYDNGKYNFELYSTDPWADYNLIDKALYHNGLDKNSGYYAKNTMATFIEAAHAKEKLAILSIGGWSCSVTLLDAMKKDPQKLAAAVAKFVNETVPKACNWTDNEVQNFDGIDIDLEPYANNWARMTNSEIQSVVDSLTALRAALPSKSISFTLGANPNIVTKVNEAGTNLWNQIKKAVDKVYIMTYDYHGSFDGSYYGTNFHTALYADPNEPDKWGDNRGKFNIDASMKAFSSVLPKDKLLFGAATYGRAYKLGTDFSVDQFASYKPSDFLYETFIDPKIGDNLVPIYQSKTNIASIAGNLGYDIYINNTKNEITSKAYQKLSEADRVAYHLKGYSIKEMLERGDLKESLIYLDKGGIRQEVITYSDGEKKKITPGTLDGCKIIGACALHKNGYFLTYDNELTIAAKAQYCKDKGYGGMIHWEGKGDVAAELVGAADSVFDPQ